MLKKLIANLINGKKEKDLDQVIPFDYKIKGNTIIVGKCASGKTSLVKNIKSKKMIRFLRIDREEDIKNFNQDTDYLFKLSPMSKEGKTEIEDINIDFNEWLDNPNDSTIYISNHWSLSDNAKSKIKEFIDNALQIHTNRHEAIEVIYILDDFLWLPKFDNLVKALSLGRSLNLKIVITVQFLDQFSEYDEKEFRDIMNTCKYRLFNNELCDENCEDSYEGYSFKPFSKKMEFFSYEFLNPTGIVSIKQTHGLS